MIGLRKRIGDLIHCLYFIFVDHLPLSFFAFIQNLNFLKKLNLDGNRLTSIPVLPPYLEVLNMNNNKLSVLTPDSFKGMACVSLHSKVDTFCLKMTVVFACRIGEPAEFGAGGEHAPRGQCVTAGVQTVKEASGPPIKQEPLSIHPSGSSSLSSGMLLPLH